jgi:hypothetical protein
VSKVKERDTPTRSSFKVSTGWPREDELVICCANLICNQICESEVSDPEEEGAGNENMIFQIPGLPVSSTLPKLGTTVETHDKLLYLPQQRGMPPTSRTTPRRGPRNTTWNVMSEATGSPANPLATTAAILSSTTSIIVVSIQWLHPHPSIPHHSVWWVRDENVRDEHACDGVNCL